MTLITTPDTSRRRIAAVGMYDGVHSGHRYLIDFVRLEGRHRGLEPAVVTFSRHPLSVVRPLEAPPLLSTLSDRVSLIASSGINDVIMLSFSDKLRRLTAEEFLLTLRSTFGIDALVVGFNNRLGHDRVDSIDRLREIGARIGIDVIAAPEYHVKGISSSAIRRALTEGKVAEAARMLGRPYSIEGTVVKGNRLGSKLGFPTANIRPVDSSLLIPMSGVYAARVTTPDGVKRPAMVNIGYRPTVSSSIPDAEKAPGELSIEAHIIDFSGYIYDDSILIEFVERLRPEKRFDTTDALASQLRSDRSKALAILEKQ